jgi:hypothetical protein
MSNNIERKFGLSALADKLLFIGPEIKADIALEQVTFSFGDLFVWGWGPLPGPTPKQKLEENRGCAPGPPVRGVRGMFAGCSREACVLIAFH